MCFSFLFRLTFFFLPFCLLNVDTINTPCDFFCFRIQASKELLKPVHLFIFAFLFPFSCPHFDGAIFLTIGCEKDFSFIAPLGEMEKPENAIWFVSHSYLLYCQHYYQLISLPSSLFFLSARCRRRCRQTNEQFMKQNKMTRFSNW